MSFLYYNVDSTSEKKAIKKLISFLGNILVKADFVPVKMKLNELSSQINLFIEFKLGVFYTQNLFLCRSFFMSLISFS